MLQNQWKLAGHQILSHWRRSGISHFPANPDAAVARAIQWLKDNHAAIFEPEVTDPRVQSPTHSVGDLSPLNPLPASPQANQVSTHRIPENNSPANNLRVTADPDLPQSVQAMNAATIPTAKFELGVWQTPDEDFVARQSSFQVLNDSVVACRKCEEIVCRRQRTVFGVGPVHARIVMFGEAPGADEDRAGEPFVGAAGQLLNKILEASGLKREEVYIMNSLKCRPPNNRTPTDLEIENCRPFFESQLETIKPEFIVCWGAIAVRAVLKTGESVGRLRGRFHPFRGAKVLVTYHPAYLLRNPEAKRLTWEDMKMLMREIGIPIPGKS